MNTNHSRLNLFESLTVVMIAAGIGLIAVMMFAALPEGQQKAVVSSLEIFDMHEAAGSVAAMAKTAMGFSEAFMDEFYLAFTQTIFVQRSDLAFIENAVGKILVYADSLALNYNQMAARQSGKIAGISISIPVEQDCDPHSGGLLCRLGNPLHETQKNFRLEKTDCNPEKAGLLCRLGKLSL